MKFLNIKPALWITHFMLCTAIVYSSSVYAQNNIGHIIYSTGEIQATNNGESRDLKRGSTIVEGDTIKSGSSTRSQLRMADGALIALRPNTEFSFEKYQYRENDDANNSSIFNLIKGGFRTISGLIGKKSKQNYRVKTTIATIGIRGTHYGLTLCQQNDCNEGKNHDIKDGLYGSVIDGEITAANETGEYVFSNDEFFHVVSSKTEPRSLLRPPGVIFDQNIRGRKNIKTAATKKSLTTKIGKRQFQNAGIVNAVSAIQHRRDLTLNHIRARFKATSDTIASPSSFIEPTVDGNVLAFSYFGLNTGAASPTPFSVLNNVRNDGTDSNQFFLNSVAKDNGLFVPVAATQTTGTNVRSLFIGDANAVELGSAVVAGLAVGWGRWTNQYVATDNGTVVPHTGHLHYIVATEVTSLTQLGGLTGSASYSNLSNTSSRAGTRATDLAGNIAATVATVNMGVTFGAAGGINAYNVNTRVGGQTYQAGFVSVAAPLSFTAAAAGGISLSGGTPCPSCVGQASVAFLGPNAEGAGTLYSISNPNATNMSSGTSGNAVNGAAILVR